MKEAIKESTPSIAGKQMLESNGLSQREDTIETHIDIADIKEQDLIEIKRELNIDGLTGRVDTPKITTNVIILRERKNPFLHLFEEFMSNWEHSGIENASEILGTGLELLEPSN